MDKHSAVVRHRGDLTMTIHKKDLTPAEIVLLRQIHGDDAVVDIHVTKHGVPVKQGEEFARLSGIYDPTLVKAAFPGALPRLPLTLEEAGIHASGASLESMAEEIGEVPGLAPDVLASLHAAGLNPASLT